MNKQRALINRIYARKRVDITTKDYLKLVKRAIITGSVLIAFIISAFLWRMNFSYLSIGISSIFAVTSFVLINYICRHVCSTSVKGDALILTSIHKRSAVTSIRSLQNIKSNCFLGFEFTEMKYNYDGKNRMSIIINRQGVYPFAPKNLIRKAFELSKKQKANHKPGSVTA